MNMTPPMSTADTEVGKVTSQAQAFQLLGICIRCICASTPAGGGGEVGVEFRLLRLPPRGGYACYIVWYLVKRLINAS